MRDFAGRMSERVDLLRRTPGWDALGEQGEDWTLIDEVWAAAVPLRPDGGPARWRITLRPCAVKVGDRIVRAIDKIEVREVTADPTRPDRLTIVGEAVR